MALHAYSQAAVASGPDEAELQTMKALGNIALVLNQANQHELALGYALSAMALRADDQKAAFHAAKACLATHESIAAEHLLSAAVRALVGC